VFFFFPGLLTTGQDLYDVMESNVG